MKGEYSIGEDAETVKKKKKLEKDKNIFKCDREINKENDKLQMNNMIAKREKVGVLIIILLKLT